MTLACFGFCLEALCFKEKQMNNFPCKKKILKTFFAQDSSLRIQFLSYQNIFEPSELVRSTDRQMKEELTRSKESMLLLQRIDDMDLYYKRIFCVLSCSVFQSKCNNHCSFKSNFSNQIKHYQNLIIFKLQILSPSLNPFLKTMRM